MWVLLELIALSSKFVENYPARGNAVVCVVLIVGVAKPVGTDELTTEAFVFAFDVISSKLETELCHFGDRTVKTIP